MLYKLWAKFLTFIGDIYFAVEPPKVKAKHIRKCLDVVQSGDIICRKYTYYLDGYFIKGAYSHSGIVINNTTMIDSVAEGVREVDILDFIKDCDGFIVIRPKYASYDFVLDAIRHARSKVGCPYDFAFNYIKKDAFYCHELTASCLYAANINIRHGKIIYAEDLINECEIIYETEGL